MVARRDDHRGPPARRVRRQLASAGLHQIGPLWRPDGVLWFSDIPANVVHQWSPDGTITEVLRPGGYDGNSLPPGFIRSDRCGGRTAFSGSVTSQPMSFINGRPTGRSPRSSGQAGTTATRFRRASSDRTVVAAGRRSLVQ